MALLEARRRKKSEKSDGPEARGGGEEEEAEEGRKRYDRNDGAEDHPKRFGETKHSAGCLGGLSNG